MREPLEIMIKPEILPEVMIKKIMVTSWYIPKMKVYTLEFNSKQLGTIVFLWPFFKELARVSLIRGNIKAICNFVAASPIIFVLVFNDN